MVLVVKNLPANAGDIRVESLIPEKGHDNPLQYSCLKNPMDKGAQRATIHRVTKSQTQLKRLSTHALWSSLALGRLGMLILSKDIVYYFNNSVSSAYCL